ncbi:MAG TPA: SpoIVB peptidase S55 domain-containing protein [Terriglobales bacterium]|nr:SpoIVB peptidase S55 domain-containing protein [Terriglobales bacterium]
MHRCRFALLFVCLTSLTAFGLPAKAPNSSFRSAGAPAGVEIMPEDQVKAGMKGVAYTVFQGTQPEPMGVEILGVLRDMAGPRADVILARLHGKQVEYTGVVAGMSGSPVYINGKLVGAIAYRIGEFSKEPICGITPAASMLEIDALDKLPLSEVSHGVTAPRQEFTRTSGPGLPASLGAPSGYADLLQPIATPLAFSGFTPDTLRLFGKDFASAGILPVMGAGSVSNDKQPEPLEPGSAVSAVLVRGDMNIAGTCTVTYIDATHLLACGHPLLQSGNIDMPMTKATVLATLPSPQNAFKIVNSTEPVGAFVQDRHAGIMGRFDRRPQMIPVTLTFSGVSHPKTFHYEVLNNAKLTPAAMMATVYNAIQGMNEYGEDTTYRLQGGINVLGYPELNVRNMYAPADGATTTAYAIALSIGQHFSRIFENPYETPKIEGVELNFDLVPERRTARLEAARTDVIEARPGDEITIDALLRPYRGDSMVREIPLRIPASTPRGTLRILVSDGDTLDKMLRLSGPTSHHLDLGSTINLLNKQHTNSEIYVSLLEADPQAVVEDKVMPTLPLSVINVMDGLRGSQDMVVVGESAVDEAAMPVDYVVTGSQIITLKIK